MPRSICFAILFAFGAGALAIGARPAAAQTQEACRLVEVVGIQHRRVELFDTAGTLVTTVNREDLGSITNARECPSTPSLLGIRVQGQRFYVRRAALRLQVAEIERPVCAAGQYASRSARDASSSGIGGASCRQPEPNQ